MEIKESAMTAINFLTIPLMTMMMTTKKKRSRNLKLKSASQMQLFNKTYDNKKLTKVILN